MITINIHLYFIKNKKSNYLSKEKESKFMKSNSKISKVSKINK